MEGSETGDKLGPTSLHSRPEVNERVKHITRKDTDTVRSQGEFYTATAQEGRHNVANGNQWKEMLDRSGLASSIAEHL